MLSDIDIAIVATAAADLCSSSQYPPSVSDVRCRAFEIKNGVKVPISALESWERVCRLSRGERVELTAIERRVLNLIGGTFTIRNSNHIAKDRDVFIRAIDEMTRSASRDASLLPAVERVTEKMNDEVRNQIARNSDFVSKLIGGFDVNGKK